MKAVNMYFGIFLFLSINKTAEPSNITQGCESSSLVEKLTHGKQHKIKKIDTKFIF